MEAPAVPGGGNQRAEEAPALLRSSPPIFSVGDDTAGSLDARPLLPGSTPGVDGYDSAALSAPPHDGGGGGQGDAEPGAAPSLAPANAATPLPVAKLLVLSCVFIAEAFAMSSLFRMAYLARAARRGGRGAGGKPYRKFFCAFFLFRFFFGFFFFFSFRAFFHPPVACAAVLPPIFVWLAAFVPQMVSSFGVAEQNLGYSVGLIAGSFWFMQLLTS